MKKSLKSLLKIILWGFLITAFCLGINSLGFLREQMQEKNLSYGQNTDKELLVLVNSQNSLPENWTVNLVELSNGNKIDKRAYPDLQRMFDDARKLGYDPLICSSYRTEEKQSELYENQVESYMNQGYEYSEALEKAKTWVSKPGTSEHQLGLAVDIVSVSNQNLDSSQEDNETQIWLMENSWKYGYILRYPKDKSEITGVNYEPWHYRFVGKEYAEKIYKNNLCLEEYISEYCQ